MKYLNYFNLHSEYTDPIIRPNVSYCKQEDEVHYNPLDYSKEYLTFDIIESGTIVWKTSHASAPTATISYSINNSTWTEITSSVSGVSLNVTAGDRIKFKGSNDQYTSTSVSYYNTFNSSTAKFDVEGNIMSLLNSDSFINVTTISSQNIFNHLFDAVHIVNAKDLILPATTLTNGCYRYMFYNCIYLVTTPELPATVLGELSYSGMFEGCTSLVVAPDLPATNLTSGCYKNMFSGCTSLNSITCLATNISASNCTQNWVSGVAASGIFIKDANTTWPSGTSGIPSGWTIQNNT